MQDSTYATLNVQPIGSNNPTTLAKNASIPLRVLVTNVGPTVIFVSKSPGDVAPKPNTSSYRVFPGQDKVYILAPKQSLYAISAGVGGFMSTSTSEALPESGH